MRSHGGVTLRPGAVRERRLALGLTLKAVIERMEPPEDRITRGMLSMVEVGRCRPSLRTLRAIALALGALPEAFLSDCPERLRPFPILAGHGLPAGQVPYQVAERAMAGWVRLGEPPSLERVERRGGFTWRELVRGLAASW